LSCSESMSRAATNVMGDRARVEGLEPLMKRAEEVVPSNQVPSMGDFIVHAARSCSVRDRLLRPRRQLARSVSKVSFSWCSAVRILVELMRSVAGSGLPSYFGGGLEATGSA